MRRLSYATGALVIGSLAVSSPALAATVVFDGTRQNVNAIAPPGSGRCAPTYFNTVSIAPGALSSTGTSNFGNFSSTQSHCLLSTPPTPLVEGIFTYSFDAGDTLFGTYSGNTLVTGMPGVLEAVENLVVTGGTGRFLGATGLLTATGQLQFGMQNNQTVGIYNGTVTGQLNIPAVPEPATWAMMLLGFFGIGSALRSTRKKQISLSYS